MRTKPKPAVLKLKPRLKLVAVDAVAEQALLVPVVRELVRQSAGFQVIVVLLAAVAVRASELIIDN
jgi:hypothetical protein